MKREIIQVTLGPDEVWENELGYLPDDTIAFVYQYELDSYEGSGEGLVRTESGWQSFSLRHCSCYGPIEGYNGVKLDSSGGISIEELAESYTGFWKGNEMIDKLISEARKIEESLTLRSDVCNVGPEAITGRYPWEGRTTPQDLNEEQRTD